MAGSTEAAERVAPFGAGVYSFPAAASLVRGVSPRQLRYWVRSGLTPPTHPRDPARPWDSDVLSFHDVISLELIRRMRAQGVSLQSIRTLESQLRVHAPEADRPFAHNIFWTDGVNVWYALEPDDDRLLVQATGMQRGNMAWKPAISTFSTEIKYGETGAATLWSPHHHIDIDPQRHFGEPVITGTRVAVHTIVANLEAGTPTEVADWYNLTVEQVEAARDYAAGNA